MELKSCILPDLYNRLNLRPKDLTSYDSLLVGVDGKTIIPKDLMKLLVQTGAEMVEVSFIVVDTYSPYTTILARLWLHAMGAVFSTLYIKVKYPLEGQVRELTGSLAMARQCLVTTIRHQSEKGASAS